MIENTDLPGGGVNIEDVRGDVAVSGDVVGRDKKISIGSITIEEFVFGGVPVEKQLEFFQKQIGLESKARYAASQFEAYCDVWRSRQALRLAGDDLWGQASTEHLTRFSEQLRNTELVVREGEIFFEEDDRTSLLDLLGALGQFELGKMRLIEIRTTQDVEWYAGGAAALAQVQANRHFRDAYEALLEKVRVSFKRRLAS